MPVKPDEDPGLVEVLTDEQFDAARKDLWQNRDPAKNWERCVITHTFCIERNGRETGLAYTDVIESVSPDIQILTSNDVRDGLVHFTIVVSGRDGHATIHVDTPDFSLVTGIHYELVQRFNSLGSIRGTLEWLLDLSKYAFAKGQTGGPLLGR